MDNSIKGTATELLVEAYYTARGFYTFRPTCQHSSIDLVVNKHNRYYAVQTKFAGWVNHRDHQRLRVKTNIPAEEDNLAYYDLFLAVDKDERIWEIPANFLTTGTIILDSTQYNFNSQWDKFLVKAGKSKILEN